jgi:hypothetical protein
MAWLMAYIARTKERNWTFVGCQLRPELAVERQGCVEDEQPVNTLLMAQGIQQTILPKDVTLVKEHVQYNNNLLQQQSCTFHDAPAEQAVVLCFQ